MDIKNIETFIKIAEGNSFTKVALETNYAQSTITTQIKQLENEGVIVGYHAELDPAKLGCNITAFINIAMEATRKLEFYDKYISSVIKEAKSLGISKEEIVSMIMKEV